MRIARGLFRLWLVISSLWVGFIFYVGNPVATFQDSRSAKQQAANLRVQANELTQAAIAERESVEPDADGEQGSPQTSSYFSENSRHFQNQPRFDPDKFRSMLNKNSQGVDRPTAMRLEALELDEVANRAVERTVYQLQLALGIPAVVLLLGLALVWAFRGFRRDL